MTCYRDQVFFFVVVVVVVVVTFNRGSVFVQFKGLLILLPFKALGRAGLNQEAFQKKL